MSKYSNEEKLLITRYLSQKANLLAKQITDQEALKTMYPWVVETDGVIRHLRYQYSGIMTEINNLQK